ncbi:hypothetical protein CO669_28480 [Bradyrhizobium sp. Y36]|uniref:DUF4238 domain-containing protein n=1 Tax=Bradyrhizobium sp. Y36 TaxID=2035447 RepID=UPI000BE9BDF2|nr:DUF4238 domain-containing protein [Bradyrhizobium sp. Y36]PDT86900.1 hypothetical protein CO669_28480 [Bradyrhizobium sp. Y36]
MDHHFNPRFYLGQWKGPDERVCELRLIRGKMVAKRKFPQNTGALKDLYRIDGVSDDIAQNLETQCFSPLDGRAAKVLRKLVAGVPELPLEDRASWARFLLSLLYRNREGVKLIKDHMADLVRATIAASEADWVKRRKPEETRSLAEALADRELGYAGTRAANIIADIISNHRALPDILRMNWVVLDLSNSTRALLTSDRPVFFGALSNPLAYIALPLGPYDLFVAAYDDRFNKSLDATEAVYRMNRDVVSNAREFVWAVDDSQVDFIRTWIGANPDRVILTDDQRDEAVAAAGKPDDSEAA